MNITRMKRKLRKFFSYRKHVVYAVLGAGILLFGIFVIWISLLSIPDLTSFNDRKIESSTKIYDRTGEILLYDVHQDFKRTIIPFTDINTYSKNATVAIEDTEFYQHHGIRVKSIVRAIMANLFNVGRVQGGSTITQQVIKNSLLTQDKTIARKIKEWILSYKIEKILSKEEILAIYLNDAPFGGSIYGIQEASQTFFKKNPADVTLAEAAYLAAIPNAPSYFSPYGKNKDKLNDRKNVVLSRMKQLNFITEEEYNAAKAEVVTFQPQEPIGIKAPHFVMYIKEYLTQKYGERALQEDGLKVITTLDYALEEKAEEITKKNALAAEKASNAENEAVVIMNPKTGEILSMVGSRDYFDKEIDGNFNVATAFRQPGSSFKPFVYATAFMKGYTDESVLFDVPTEFNPSCAASGNGKGASCYSPDDFDTNFKGPMHLRDALGQSRNIPAVKLLYLVGVDNALKTAKDMGIKSLTTASQYGLSLVLGGGEVSLLDMVSAYGVFAQGGVRVPTQKIIKIEDKDGNILEEMPKDIVGSQVIDKNASLLVSDILSDNVARTPTFTANSTLNIPGRQVAVKTGTTNLNKDGWMIGYTPSVVVGVWSGNNDNTPMKKGSTVSGPTWNAVMREALKGLPDETFESPDKPEGYNSFPPVMRGKWQGGIGFVTDSYSHKLATELTPPETREEHINPEVHDILYWIDKADPKITKAVPGDSDAQFTNWETAVQLWWEKNKGNYTFVYPGPAPTEYDDMHIEANMPIVTFVSPTEGQVVNKTLGFDISITSTGVFPVNHIDIFINDVYIKSVPSVLPVHIDTATLELSDTNTLALRVVDSIYNAREFTTTFTVN